MGVPAIRDVYFFECFRLDQRGLFRRDPSGAFAPVEIGSRALDVLQILVERARDLVLRDEIMVAVWPGTVVESSNLPVQIAALRRVIDNGRTEGSCIQTVSGRGYRFVAPVVRGTDSAEVVAALPKVEAEARRSARARFRRRYATAAVLAGALIIAGGLWLWPSPTAPPATARAPVATTVTSTVPRLSIVVLPFANLSNDPDQQYLVDAITEDLTTDLSRISGNFVISRNTAFAYRNKPVSEKQIGHELGVRYVLEGSVQRSGKQMRVNAQLIDADTDAHLWAERFEHDVGDLFALQNEITSRIAIALSVAMVGAEAARPTNNPDAFDLILRGRAADLKPISRDSYEERISMFERALTADPGSVEAQSRLAIALVDRVLDFDSSTEEADLKRAEELATIAVAASPRSEVAHMAKANMLRARRRCGEAIREYETALALNRNLVNAWAAIGRCKIFIGPIEEAILPQEQAIRLSPLDPHIATWYYRIGEAHLLQSQLDDAILWFEKARSANEGLAYVHGALASAYALKGDTDHAAAELAEARKLVCCRSSIARLRANTRYETPAIRALAEATLYAGLRKAGVPEE